MLKETLDKAYEIFAKYQANRPLDVCTDDCCMKVEDEGRLANFPVNEIPIELLAEYNDSAKPEKTRIEEVKHFLPRYLELISQFRFPTHSTELSFSRLIPFDKNEWTKQEFEILVNFSTDFFRHTLLTYPLPSFNDRIDSILIMFWRAKFNLEKLLMIWEQINTVESLLHFKDLYFHGFKEYNRSELFSSFGDKELNNKLIDWIEKEKTREIFEKHIERAILGNFELDEKTLNELNLLYEIIRTEKKNPT
jgi:hypothetical protein